MNILMCTPRMGIGGAETHVLSLSAELVRKGHRVAVASSGGAYVRALEAAGVSHYELPLDRRGLPALLRSRAGLQKLLRELRPDVVHAHGRLPAFVCGTLGRRNGRPPLVTTAHGLYDPSVPKGPLTEWGDLTVAVSETVRGQLVGSYGLPGDRITVIPNGVDPADPVRPPHEGFGILMCCRLDRDSAGPVLDMLDLLVPLRERFPSASPVLTVAGDGNAARAVAERAEAIMKLPGHEGCVRLVGAVTDVPSLYPGTDLFAGSSRSAAEAMAAGIPVLLLSPVPGGSVCSGIMGPGSVEAAFPNNYVTCRAEPGSPSLWEALAEAVGGGTARLEAGAAHCRDFVRSHNGAAAVAGMTLEVYRRAVAGRRPGVFLCGYFGAGNAGDDASLEVAVSGIREFAPDSPIYVTSGPLRKDLPEGTVPLAKADLAGCARAMSSCRLFALCGGTLLQNGTSARSLAYYTCMCSLARRRGCRTLLMGGGIGPVRGRAARRRVRACLSSLDGAALRDGGSFSAVSALSAGGGSCVRAADMALLTRPLPLPDGIAVPAGAVAVLPRGLLPRAGRGPRAEFEAALGAAVRALADAGRRPVLIPLSPSDRPLCARLCAEAPGSCLAPDLRPGETVTFLAGCEAALAVRLHGAVFSLAAGTPCVCAAYDRKVSAFAAENGLVSFRTDEDGLAEKLAAAVLRAAAGERLPPPDPELLRLAREPVAEAERLFGCR